jgi:pSer/pThr/pTyr-binding forkhead associated (FHA) protein
MEVKLVVLGGSSAGQAIRVRGPKFFIGRAEDCQLRPNSDLVSRHHCAIMVDEGLVTIRDFGSRNGTYINGERIRGEEELNPGDHLKVGPLEFEVHVEVSLAAPKKPKVESVEQAAARTVETAAAAPSGGDDIDISGWLGGADAANDTRSLDPAQQNTVAVNSDRTNAWKPPEPPEPQQAEKEEKKTDKDAKRKQPNPPHGIKKPKAVDSQAAAADTLRHFFHRR